MQTDTNENNQRVYDINRIKNKLGIEAAENLLVCQEISGCDIASRLYGVEKPAVVSLSLRDGMFEHACKIFITLGSNHQEIVEAGEKDLLPIYK